MVAKKTPIGYNYIKKSQEDAFNESKIKELAKRSLSLSNVKMRRWFLCPRMVQKSL